MFPLAEMSTLEEHPVFNPDIKIANQQQNEMKKPPLSSEAPLNLSLLEKSGAVPQEQKGDRNHSVQYKVHLPYSN